MRKRKEGTREDYAGLIVLGLVGLIGGISLIAAKTPVKFREQTLSVADARIIGTIFAVLGGIATMVCLIGLFRRQKN